MIFRDHNGMLVDIKKLDYTRDSHYYRAILIAKKKELPLRHPDERDRILNIFRTSVPIKKGH